jgi:hypothetical protein
MAFFRFFPCLSESFSPNKSQKQSKRQLAGEKYFPTSAKMPYYFPLLLLVREVKKEWKLQSRNRPL